MEIAYAARCAAPILFRFGADCGEMVPVVDGVHCHGAVHDLDPALE